MAKRSLSVLHPTLYTPATKEPEAMLMSLNGRANGVWRVVMCTEDSIRADEIPVAIETLRTVLAGMNSRSRVTAYVRVRNPEVLRRVLDLPNADKLRGFVIPKADPTTLPLYADQLAGTEFKVMPILESPLMFDRAFREVLRTAFMDPAYRDKIDCLRIGANDLMGYLGIRRDNHKFTIYDTPVGHLIYEFINEYRGIGGFTITAPVFECYGPAYDGLLRREVQQHIVNGLFGQTVIHPRHLRILRDMYKVSELEHESAKNMLAAGCRAVVGLDGRMDEVTTHAKWARVIADRYRLFGDDSDSKTGLEETGITLPKKA